MEINEKCGKCSFLINSLQNLIQMRKYVEWFK